NLLNYAFGVMRVSLKDYILGSLGMIPGTVMYVYLGALAGDIALIGTAEQPVNLETQLVKWSMHGIGLLATVGISIYLGKVAKNILEENN
ncbi:MAG: TVP38/TMEM64 family protein, partial [Cyanobacteriota bacterium]|nr:TVP38/TMEM64 family protein [Cyanobacteriota bacterium]